MHSHLNRNKFWSESSRITRKYVVGDVFIMLQCLSLLHNAPVPVTKALTLYVAVTQFTIDKLRHCYVKS